MTFLSLFLSLAPIRHRRPVVVLFIRVSHPTPLLNPPFDVRPGFSQLRSALSCLRLRRHGHTPNHSLSSTDSAWSASSAWSHADRRPAHPTYAPARGLDLALRANTDGDMDLDTASVKTAPGPSLPIVSTLSCAPLSPTPSAPRGSSPHASESRAQVSASGMGSSLNENAHVREMRAQTLNRPQDPAQRPHTHIEWNTAWSGV
ncbi:hypothetical protein JB92DRAFT_3122458 [Gautieria morchelliformis]|nr:hypothetical protein JB92DRAFT_3122458 [Gautieria morchelliformis]